MPSCIGVQVNALAATMSGTGLLAVGRDQGASYRLNAADPLCGGKLGLGGQLVLVMDGKVYAKVSDKDVKVQNEAPRAVGTQPAQQPAQQPGQTQQQQPAAPAQQPGYAPATPLQAQPADDSNILKPEQPRPSSY